MAKKIYLSPSSQYQNLYKKGNTTEQTQCRNIATACANFLKKNGFEVKCANYGTMYSRVEESNNWGADMHVPIHTNAFNGTITGGTQIYLISLKGERKKAADAIFKRLAPLTPGTSHEKITTISNFYEINRANAMTVYLECEFHDTVTGASYIVNNTTAIGEAIAKGICDYYGVKFTEDKTPAAKPQTQPQKVNADVKAWQIAAIADGYSFPKHGADGDWGTECEAVAKKAVCKKRILGYTNKNLTKFVQKKVGLSGNDVDGKFGKDTKEAVKEYQKRNGLTVDGVVGYNTWKKMCSVK